MSTKGRIGRRRDAEQPERRLWFGSARSADAYDAATADGNCPNPGHAPVRLFPTRVQSTETKVRGRAGAASAPPDRPPPGALEGGLTAPGDEPRGPLPTSRGAGRRTLRSAGPAAGELVDSLTGAVSPAT